MCRVTILHRTIHSLALRACIFALPSLLLWRIRAKPAALYHTGWLGQWLIVDRKRRLVAVRLREQDRWSEDATLEAGRIFSQLDALHVDR